MTIHLPAKATFISITPRQRQQIEGLIESLIAMLDTIDGNENDEDDGCDEPVLGWSTTNSFGDPRIDEGEIDEDFELDAGDMPELDYAESGMCMPDEIADDNVYCLSFAFDRNAQETADQILYERISAERIPVTLPGGKVRIVARQP